MTMGNRAIQGQPQLPYIDKKVWANNDVFVTLTFVDRSGNPAVPTSLTLEIDDMTNAQVMLGPTNFTSTGGTVPPLNYPAFASSMLVQVPASIMQMSYPYQGSQIVQFAWSWTAIDAVSGQTYTGTRVDAIELVAVATVTGCL